MFYSITIDKIQLKTFILGLNKKVKLIFKITFKINNINIFNKKTKKKENKKRERERETHNMFSFFFSSKFLTELNKQLNTSFL